MNELVTIDDLLDSYEAICDHARLAREHLDNWRWVLGDDALRIEKRYGLATIADFARDVGMHKTTVDSYRRVSRFYPKNRRMAEIFEAFPNLTYAYFKDAARNVDIEAALLWLAEISDNGWSADEASHKLTERLGRNTRISAVIGTISGFDGNRVVIQLNDGCEWLPGTVVSLREVRE